MSNLPTMTAVIPTYQRGMYLIATIRQLLEQQPPADEILVIDQTPVNPPEVEAALETESRAHRIRRIRQPVPDLQIARNRGLCEARGDVVVYLDDDVVLPPGFIAAHRRNYADPAVAGVAGRVKSRLTPADADVLPLRRPGGPRFDCLYFRLDGPRRVAGVANWVGANFSARRRALREIGGHDETYAGYGFDDVDTAVRLWRAGKLIVYDPDAWLDHLMAPTGGQGLRPQQIVLWKRFFGEHYFLLRHVFPHWRYGVRLLLFCRRAILNRAYLRRPWLLPQAGGAYLYALGRALGSKPRLPLRADGPTEEKRIEPDRGL